MIKKSRAIWIILYLIIFGHLLSKCDFLGNYAAEFAVLLFGYIIIGGIFIYLILIKKSDIFEPIPIVLLLLISLFSIAPIELTAEGIVTLAGVNFIGGCIKVTILYMFCSVAFVIGYYKCKVIKNIRYNINEGRTIVGGDTLLFVLIVIWGVCLFLGFWFQYRVRGMSFQYILTLGLRGSYSSKYITESSVNFILNFSYSTIVPWLYFMFYYKNKIIKVITSIFMITLYIVCGWRNVIIIMGLSAVCMYYTKNEKRPTMKQILLVISCGLIFLGLLGATRGALRTGASVNNEVFELNNIFDSVVYSLETNFNLYQPFYAIANKYPSQYMYTFGKAIIWDTLVTVIPRAIWPGKPLAFNNSLNLAIRRSTADIVVNGYAMAVPSIGEYYVDFGFVGAIIICYIMGITSRHIKEKYNKPNGNINDLITYSIFFGVLFVLVMRGCTPNNFYYVIFLIWPNWVVKKISNTTIRKNEQNAY